MVAVLLALTFPSLASAYHGPATAPENLGAVTGLTETGGGVNVPGTGSAPNLPDPNDPRIGDWWTKEHQGFTGQPNSEQIHRQTNKLRSRVRVLPSLTTLGRFAVGGAAGVIAWTVGEQVLTALFPEKGAVEGSGKEVTHVYYMDAGQVITSLSGTHFTVTECMNEDEWGQCYAIAPTSGWAVEAKGSRSYTNATAPGGGPSPCHYPAVGLPAGAVEVHFRTTVPQSGYCNGHTLRNVAYLIPGGIYPGTPTNPTHTKTTSSWPNQPSSAAELQQRVEDELESDNYPAPNAWLAHQLEPENFPDPAVTETEHDHSCDRTPGPRYANPGGNVDPAPFAKHITAPFAISNRPASYEDVDVYLHEGITYWGPGVDPQGTNPWYLDDWRGWGFRHIVAKHGWGATDRQEAELTLGAAFPEPQGAGKYLYVLRMQAPGAGGVACDRHVVVKFEAGIAPDGTPDPRPIGIMTSFNKVIP